MADISQIKAPDGTTYNLKDGVGRKEAYLEWGGKNFEYSFGVIDAALVSDLGANRLMFAKAAGITIEYSRDTGSTWTDYGAGDSDKVGLFSSGGAFAIGKADSTNKATANGNKYQLRVTLDTGAAGIYTVLNKFVLNVNTSGSANCTVKIQKALQNAPTTYTDVTDDVGISGWSGYNVINVSAFTTYGNTPSTQYGRIRFIFKANGGNTNYNGLIVTQIMGFGGVGWTTPSTMAKTGHLYSFDSSQNATFPARVTATEFSGKLVNRTVDATTVDNTSGTFAFSGSNGPFNGTDWVGLQVGDNVDKFQIVAKDGTLMMRQNDSGGSNTGWQAWRRVLDEGNFSNFALPLTGGTMTGGIILQTDSSGFNDKGLVWANNTARIGASQSDLGLYAKGNIYLRPNSETTHSTDGIVVTTDGLFPGNQNGTETLGGVSSRWANVWSKEGNFSGTVLMSPGENFIQWQDSGNWSATNHLKEGESFPINRGGLYWTGQSDWVKLYAQETAADKLDLVLQFGDDANPQFNIKNKDGTNVTYITAGGEVGAITGKFGTSASSPRFIVQGTTYATNTYADNNPKIDFRNASDSQNISLTFTDYDSVQNPTSLTLNGNQGNEYFIAPNIKATTKFHGNLEGTASKVTFNADNNSGKWNALLGGRDGYTYYDWALQWNDETDSTSTRGSFLSLGNSTATGTSGNKRGVLRLWGSKSYCMDIYGPDGITANRVLYLPDTTNTGHIVGTSTTEAVGSANQPVYISSSGIATACSIKLRNIQGYVSPVFATNVESTNDSLGVITGLMNSWKHLRRNSSYSIITYTTTATNFTPASINKTAVSIDVDALFDDDSCYAYTTGTLNGKTLVIDVVHPSQGWSNLMYVDFGASGWCAKSIRVLTGSGTGAFTQKLSVDNWASSTYVGYVNFGTTFQNKTRFVLYNWTNSSNQRLCSVGCICGGINVFQKPYYAGTADMTAGSSFLATNDVYFVYE